MSLQLHIEKLVYGGDGLSRLDGEVVLTPFVLPGETVEAEKTESRKHVQRARLVRVEQPSPDRVEPLAPCSAHAADATISTPHTTPNCASSGTFSRKHCGAWGKIDFEAARIGIESAEPFGYRNRAQFHFERGRGVIAN